MKKMRKMTVLLDKSCQILYSYTLSRAVFPTSIIIKQKIFYTFFPKTY